LRISRISSSAFRAIYRSIAAATHLYSRQ